MVLAVVLVCAGAAPADAVTVRDGLVTEDDLGGVTTKSVPRGAVNAFTRTVDGGAQTAVLRSSGPTPTIVVSRAVRASAAGRLRARTAKRWNRDDAAAARIKRFSGSSVVWTGSGLAGRVAVSGLAPKRARALAQEAVAAIKARLLIERQKTPWQRVTTFTGGKGPSTKQALQAFSMAFERVPGVRVPSGHIDQPGDGTLALRWAIARRGTMNKAQRAVVDRWTTWLRGAPKATSARAANLESDWTEIPSLTAEAQAQADVLAAKLGFPLTLALRVGTTQHDAANPGDMMATESAAEDGNASAGVPVSCWITVFKAGAVKMDTYRRELFAHEVFHCYQDQMSGEIATIAERYTNGTTWWVEGGADWAACNAVPGADKEPAIAEWRETPRFQLMDRTYDGVGFFTLLSGSGIDLWPRWPQIAKTESTYAAFNAAAGPEYDFIRRVWAASFLQDGARGEVWDLDPAQPCMPNPRPWQPSTLFIDDGTWDSLTARAYAARLYTLYSDADVIHFNVQDGDVRLNSDVPKVDETNLHDKYYCTDLQTDCTCPANSSRTGPPPPKISGAGGTILAVTGGRGGVIDSIEGMTREEYCKVKLGLIVPGRSIGDVYLGQSRKSVLRKVPGLVAIESGYTTKNANGLLLSGDALIGIVFQIHFGLCSSPALEPGGAAACKQQFPQSEPNQVASIQTSSQGYATKIGLGPGSDAAAVVDAFGAGYCEREPGTPEEKQPWSECRVPAAGGGMTTWGFTTKDGANYVLAVAVYNPKAMPD